MLLKNVFRRKARAIIRGLRAVSDFEYEFQMALMNKKLQGKIETVFYPPAVDFMFVEVGHNRLYSFVSSSSSLLSSRRSRS